VFSAALIRPRVDNMSVRIDISKCSGCGACANVCPQYAISVRNNLAMVDSNRCADCGRCVRACPSGAIEQSVSTPVQKQTSGNKVLRYGTDSGPGDRQPARSRAGYRRDILLRGRRQRLYSGRGVYPRHRMSVYPPSSSTPRKAELVDLRKQARQARYKLEEIEKRISRLSNNV